MEYFYRFRSINALLGERQELEKQEIYFSPPEDLNDPIEGFKDLFWQGDHIVWRNLLKHYLLCLMKCTSIAFISGKQNGPFLSTGIILGSKQSLPEAPIRTIYERICTDFFSAHGLDEVPELLGVYPHALRRDGLEFCLRNIHTVAFNTIIRAFCDANMIRAEVLSNLPIAMEASMVENLKTTLRAIIANKEGLDPEHFRIAFLVGRNMLKQVEFQTYMRTPDEARAWHSLMASFPEIYVDRLGDLIFPDWYVACFVSNPHQAAMWGTYGDSHKGICLKFRAVANASNFPSIKLQGLTGGHAKPQGSVPNYGFREMTFDEMTYVDKFVAIDFFRSLGRLQISTLESEWYSDEDGNVSECGKAVLSSDDEWRRDYWASFHAMATAKFVDWKHEKERRLVLASPLDLFTESRDRKLKYKFSDLEGVIFGVRTPIDAREQIIKYY